MYFVRSRCPSAWPLSLALVVMSGVGCKHGERTTPSALPSAGAAPLALTPELSRAVLAKVGEREITLGEYAATLERMDPMERLRYQSADRRKQLLNEIVQLELLSQEAQR